MSTRLLGIHVADSVHNAAHMTAKRKGLTLTDWLLPIIRENIDPEVASLFLSTSAQSNEQNHLSDESDKPAA